MEQRVGKAEGRAAAPAGTKRRKVALFINSAAGLRLPGRPRVSPGDIADLCSREGLDTVLHDIPPTGLEEAVRAAISGQVDIVAAGGGDGTMSSMAGILAGGSVPLGILPLGTLNHFAKDLNIPLDLEEAIRCFARESAREIDVGEINGSVFINNASLGGYPHAVKLRDAQRQRFGRGKWLAMFIACVAIFRRYPLLRLKLALEGQEVRRTTPVLFVGNNEYTMSFFTIKLRPRLDQGKLYVYLANCRSRSALVRLFWLYLAGGLEQAKDFESYAVAECWVETGHRQLQVARDGEVLQLPAPLHFRTRPGALKVIAPPPKRQTS